MWCASYFAAFIQTFKQCCQRLLHPLSVTVVSRFVRPTIHLRAILSLEFVAPLYRATKSPYATGHVAAATILHTNMASTDSADYILATSLVLVRSNILLINSESSVYELKNENTKKKFTICTLSL